MKYFIPNENGKRFSEEMILAGFSGDVFLKYAAFSTDRAGMVVESSPDLPWHSIVVSHGISID